MSARPSDRPDARENRDYRGENGDGYRSVLFDLDGTLTDPGVGITRAVQYALAKLGIETGGFDELKKYIGPPLRASFKEFHHVSEEQSFQALSYYREYYEKTGMLENAEYPGISELLAGLKERGRKLFVATSKPWVYARKILSHFAMDRYFSAIEGSELDETRTDKAEVIGYVLQKHRLEKQTTVMVGDRAHDIVGAAKNGIDSIGVGYGFGSREELETARATYYVETIGDLAAFLL